MFAVADEISGVASQLESQVCLRTQLFFNILLFNILVASQVASPSVAWLGKACLAFRCMRNRVSYNVNIFYICG